MPAGTPVLLAPGHDDAGVVVATDVDVLFSVVVVVEDELVMSVEAGGGVDSTVGLTDDEVTVLVSVTVTGGAVTVRSTVVVWVTVCGLGSGQVSVWPSIEQVTPIG